MTVENDFLPFAVGGDANVLTQVEYAALTSILQNGFQSGIAQSAQLNKVWRQSSIMAAVLASFIAQETGQSTIDDGTTATLLTNLTQAVVLASKQRVILTDTGAANAYAASNTVPMTALPTVSGMVQTVQIAHTNTGTSTYAPDGLAAKPIFSLAGVALQGNELLVGGIATLVSYVGPLLNSGNLCWVLYECIGGAQQVPTATGSQHAIPFGQIQAGVNYVAAGGTADALTATLASGLTALTDGFPLTVKAAYANATTTPTLNLTLGTTATGAKTIVKGAGAALSAGDIAGANHELQLTYNATLGEWSLNNAATSSTTGTTAPQFDTSTKYATDAFVQRALGNDSGLHISTGTETLTAAQAGATVVGYSASAFTVTLPATSAVVAGTRIEFMNFNTGAMTIAQAGSDTINTAAAVTSVVLGLGDNLALVAGTGQWYVVAGNATLGASAAFIAAVNALISAYVTTLINNTGASSDISLSVNQSAYVDVSAATSAPLHVATADNQLYEVSILGAMTGNSSVTANQLLPNNTSYTNFFVVETGFVGGTVSGSGAYANGFVLAIDGVTQAFCRVSTKTTAKSVVSTGYCTNGSSQGLAAFLGSAWLATASSLPTLDTTTAWTSLGTLTFANAFTGRIVIKRIA